MMCDAIPVERHDNIDTVFRCRERSIREPYLIKIVPAADARFIVLVAEHMATRARADPGYGLTDGLDPLPRLTADLDGIVHDPLFLDGIDDATYLISAIVIFPDPRSCDKSINPPQ